MKKTRRTILITGASSGFGRVLAASAGLSKNFVHPKAPELFELNLVAGTEFTMPRSQQYKSRLGGTELWAIIAAFVIVVLMIVFATPLHAQISEQCSFTGGAGSANPPTVSTIDRTDLTH
jgi:H+/gluconate symporter-like permease